MYHSHIIRESNINTPKLYEGFPSLSLKSIATFEENQYKHNYKPVKDGQFLLKHKYNNFDNIRKHRA